MIIICIERSVTLMRIVLYRWRSMEIHDIVVECNKMSLDPVEGTWEELHCPIIAGRYLSDRVTTSHDRQRQRHVVQPLSCKYPIISCRHLSDRTSANEDSKNTLSDPLMVIIVYRTNKLYITVEQIISSVFNMSAS
jgi:hypothetical protein